MHDAAPVGGAAPMTGIDETTNVFVILGLAL
jgi:hypothetical protein